MESSSRGSLARFAWHAYRVKQSDSHAVVIVFAARSHRITLCYLSFGGVQFQQRGVSREAPFAKSSICLTCTFFFCAPLRSRSAVLLNVTIEPAARLVCWCHLCALTACMYSFTAPQRGRLKDYIRCIEKNSVCSCGRNYLMHLFPNPSCIKLNSNCTVQCLFSKLLVVRFKMLAC